MKIGQTYSQRDAARQAKLRAEYGVWRPWFAWRPIPLPDGRRVWLEWVERAPDYIYESYGYLHTYSPPFSRWKYRERP